MQKLVLLLILSISGVDLSAKSKNDTVYRANYYPSYYLEELVTKSKVIRKPLSQVLIEGHPNLSREICRYLKIGQNDTVIVLKTNIYVSTQEWMSIIKYGENIREIYYEYDTKNINEEKFKVTRLTNNGYNKNCPTIDIANMIMFNVIFNWDMEDIKCLMESNEPASENFWIVDRYILKNDKVIQHISLNFDGAILWNLKKCYGKKIPIKYLRDLRYESDSTIVKYLKSYIFGGVYEF